MRSIPSVTGSLRAIGGAGQAMDSWARHLYLAHRRRLLASMQIFDSESFGRIRGAGALGRLGQLRVQWWHDLAGEAQRTDATSVVVAVDQLNWLLREMNNAQKE